MKRQNEGEENANMNPKKRYLRKFLFGIVVMVTFIFLIHESLRWNANTVTPQLEDSSVKENAYINLEGESVSFSFQCSTCAIVGYSGNLKNFSLGHQIDAGHSCIFRLGFSPTRDYSDDVGHRTTARIVDSFRFYPYLKKPEKLVTSSLFSEFWFLSDWKPGDITRFHLPALKKVTAKHDSRFYWFSRQTERDILQSLSTTTKIKSKSSGVSSLWFATRVIRDSNCKSLDVYGIPDPFICKKYLNLSVPSLYWDTESADLCIDGVDSSFGQINGGISPSPLLPTPQERKAFFEWIQQSHL